MHSVNFISACPQAYLAACYLDEASLLKPKLSDAVFKWLPKFYKKQRRYFDSDSSDFSATPRQCEDWIRLFESIAKLDHNSSEITEEHVFLAHEILNSKLSLLRYDDEPPIA